MALTLEEKLNICQSTIKDLQDENATLKLENEKLKTMLSAFTKDGETQVIDYIGQLNDAIDAVNKVRADSMAELKKNAKEMKKSRRKMDKFVAKTKLQAFLSGIWKGDE